MRTKELLELFDEAGHIVELSRLLLVFKQQHTTQLGEVELIDLANGTAGASYRYPSPEPALNIALTVGLLQKNRKFIFLTETGKLFLRLQGEDKLVLSFEQAGVLLGLFLDDISTLTHMKSLFRHFGQGSRGRLEAKSNPAVWDSATQATARILQQLGVLEEEEGNGKLFLNTAFESILPRHVLALTVINEQALWDRLEVQRLRAQKAEELVLIEEKKRLVKIGCSELAKLVIRVSLEDVSAGYDILSFEKDGSPRLIEVKSSIGRAIRFEWSVRERELASENNERYWIYFVPLANILEKRTLPILMLRNPAKLVKLGSLLETPSSFLVFSKTRLTLTHNDSSGREVLREWL